MTACTYARFCGKRMAHGDRANGCNDVDEAACNPALGSTPTAPAATDAPRPIWLRAKDLEKPR